MNSNTPRGIKLEKYQNCCSQISTSLSAFYPNSKSSVYKRCVKQLPPGLKSKVIDEISPAASSSPIIDIYKSSPKRRNNICNCARTLVLSKIAQNKNKQMH